MQFRSLTYDDNQFVLLILNTLRLVQFYDFSMVIYLFETNYNETVMRFSKNVTRIIVIQNIKYKRKYEWDPQFYIAIKP